MNLTLAFLILTFAETGLPVYVNVSRIDFFGPDGTGNTAVQLAGGWRLTVSEDTEHIAKRLTAEAKRV